MIAFALTLLGLSVIVCIANIGGSVAAFWSERTGGGRSYTNVPLITLVCSFGAWAVGGETIGTWAFIPAAADPGTWVLLVLPLRWLRRKPPAE